MDRWVAGPVDTLELAGSAVHVGVIGLLRTVGSREFEVDVVIRGHRLYLISCTTDSTVGVCKNKAFEVVLRARQLCGDLARPAVSTFRGTVAAPDGEESANGLLVTDDLAMAWGAKKVLPVFD